MRKGRSTIALTSANVAALGCNEIFSAHPIELSGLFDSL